MHHHKDVERDQSWPSPDLNGRKVGGCDRIPVSSKEGAPGRAALALWSWLDAVGFENVANRGVRDVEAPGWLKHPGYGHSPS